MFIRCLLVRSCAAAWEIRTFSLVHFYIKYALDTEFHTFIVDNQGSRPVVQHLFSSVIGFSVIPLSVVGLRLPFPGVIVSPVVPSVTTAVVVYSDYVKQRILFYRRLGMSFVQITCCKGTSYCQMIQDVNKEKDLSGQDKIETCHLKMSLTLMRTTVHIETHGRTCCYKRGQ